MGNIHPRFWGWYMGASNFTGALGDFLAAVDGSNLGGGNTAAARIDMQVVDWLKEMVGFPASASGTLTSGGSMANMVGPDRRAKHACRCRRSPGRCYCPCRNRFVSIRPTRRIPATKRRWRRWGLARKACVYIPSDTSFRMDLTALEEPDRDGPGGGDAARLCYWDGGRHQYRRY